MPLDGNFDAIIGALSGGAGLKLIEFVLNKVKSKEDIAAALRNELRDDSRSKTTQINDLQDDLQSVTEKYYLLWQKFVLYVAMHPDTNDPDFINNVMSELNERKITKEE